jgi:hypothetical protein
VQQETKDRLYRVRFMDRNEKDLTEVVVRSVAPSELFGLVCLEDFVFNDQRKFIILPEEDAARKKFAKTERLHLPYHNLVYVEEFLDEPTDVRNLPFVREVKNTQDTDESREESTAEISHKLRTGIIKSLDPVEPTQI